MWELGVLRHGTDTKKAKPIKLDPRRVPVHFQTEIRDIMEGMLRNNIIQPAQSPRAAPVVLVQKKDDGLRFLTKWVSFPLLIMEDLLNALGTAIHFSTLDLAPSYWQVELEPRDREKTALVIPSGMYVFHTTLMGLTNASFQRLTNPLLEGLTPTKCIVYIDDVLVHGRTMDQHLKNLDLFMHQIREAALKPKPNEFKFFLSKVSFLGHITSCEGIKIDTLNWPTTWCATDLRNCLGFISYFRFLRYFAMLAKPLLNCARMLNLAEMKNVQNISKTCL